MARGPQLLAEEKRLTRERDAAAAKRRRMPWLAVDKRSDSRSFSRSLHQQVSCKRDEV